MKNRATTAMSATTHSKVRSAAGGRRCRFHYRIRPGRADVRLLELAFGSLSEVNGDTGFELRGGMGCHVGRDGRAILHAVDEPGGAAGDEPGSDQVLQAPTSALSRSGRRDGERPNGMVTIAAPAPGARHRPRR